MHGRCESKEEAEGSGCRLPSQLMLFSLFFLFKGPRHASQSGSHWKSAAGDTPRLGEVRRSRRSRHDTYGSTAPSTRLRGSPATTMAHADISGYLESALARRSRRQRRASSVRVRVPPSRVPVAEVSSMLYTRENTRRNARDDTNDETRRAVLVTARGRASC